MENIISLGINKFEIDWGKNHQINDYSEIFSKGSSRKEIEYYYINDNLEKEIVTKIGASQKLSEIKDRLDLIGYTLFECKKKYDQTVRELNYYNDSDFKGSYLNFNEYSQFICSLDLKKIDIITTSLNAEHELYDFGYGEYFKKCILKDNEIEKKIYNFIEKMDAINTDIFETLDPLITLRLLATNKENLDYQVEWRYYYYIESGYYKEKQLNFEIPVESKLLLLTEGKSDTRILKKSIEYIYPHIFDLFNFVDVEKDWSITSCSELAKFCKGLYKIGIQNNVLAIFDNDVAGLEAFEQIPKSLQKAKNLLVIQLPDLDEMKKMKTIGPSGERTEDVNKKAVAIECFLDFSSVNFEPRVRWFSYNKKFDSYQGAIEQKDDLSKKFYDTDLSKEKYDISKLTILIDYILECWRNRFSAK